MTPEEKSNLWEVFKAQAIRVADSFVQGAYEPSKKELDDYGFACTDKEAEYYFKGAFVVSTGIKHVLLQLKPPEGMDENR